MQESREMMKLNEHLSDAEIMSAIFYLDPDLSVHASGEHTGTRVEIGIAVLAALTGALTYIGLFVRDL
jgi:hypothetical protein